MKKENQPSPFDKILAFLGKSGIRITPEGKVKPHNYNYWSLIFTSVLPIYQEVGSKYGITVSVIAEKGERYEFPGSQGTYQGFVPNGCVYVEISSPKEDLGDFWAEVRAKQNKMKPYTQAV